MFEAAQVINSSYCLHNYGLDCSFVFRNEKINSEHYKLRTVWYTEEEFHAI